MGLSSVITLKDEHRERGLGEGGFPGKCLEKDGLVVRGLNWELFGHRQVSMCPYSRGTHLGYGRSKFMSLLQ